MTEALLARYLANKTTPPETRLILDWLATPEGQRLLSEQLKADLDATDWTAHVTTEADKADAARLLSAIHARMDGETEAFDSGHNVPVIPLGAQPRRWWPSWGVRAAGALLILSLGYAGYVGYRQANPTEQLVATAYGKTQVVELPDHSKVTLNGNSRLRYAPNWTDGQPREVWLEGEGFFDVTHTTQHAPFRVHLPDKLQIEVLGTTFNVSARVTQTQVVLNSGHIRLSSAQKPGAMDMKPGDLFEANRTTQTVNIVRRRVDPAVFTSWRNDQLTFDRTSLADIVRRLEDTYGLHVTVSDPALLKQEFSGTVPNQNVDVLLDGLSSLFGLNVRKQGNQLFLEPSN